MHSKTQNKRLHVIRESEILPSDRKNQRLWRSGYIADLASKNGFEVYWWTKSFDHYNKRQRSTKNKYFKDIKIKTLKGLSYKKNLSVMRLFSEFFWSFYLFFILAKDIKKGDLIFCSMPTITSTFTAAAISHLFNVRLIIDLRDQWPEIFKDTKMGKSFIGKPFILILELLLGYSINRAHKIYSVNENYHGWLSRKYNKKIQVEFLPMAYPVDIISGQKTSNLTFYKDHEDACKIVFAGSLNSMMDIDWLISVINKFNNYYLIIAGDGENKEEWIKKLSFSSTKVKFVGHLDQFELSRLMLEADVGIAPYQKIQNFLGHVPNKIPEYLAHNLKIIGTLSGSYYNNLKTLNYYADDDNLSSGDVMRFITHKNSQNEYTQLIDIIDLKKQYMKVIEYLDSI